jgi:hypothetical protein
MWREVSNSGEELLSVHDGFLGTRIWLGRIQHTLAETSLALPSIDLLVRVALLPP